MEYNKTLPCEKDSILKETLQLLIELTAHVHCLLVASLP